MAQASAPISEGSHHPDDTVFAMAAAREGSGVRARWMELPDCGPVGKLNLKVPVYDQEIIPLKGDLTNATVATCKSYDPNLMPPKPKEMFKATLDDIGPTLGDEPEAKKEAPKKPFIWDPIIHTTWMPLKEHNH